MMDESIETGEKGRKFIGIGFNYQSLNNKERTYLTKYILDERRMI